MRNACAKHGPAALKRMDNPRKGRGWLPLAPTADSGEVAWYNMMIVNVFLQVSIALNAIGKGVVVRVG